VAVVEDIELRVTVNGLQAQKALDETRVAAEKMGGGAAKAAGGLEGLQKNAQALQGRLAPAAAAISGVAGALGQAGGEAGKVVAGIGQLTAAFGAGGPFGVAVVAASLGVDALSKHWQDLTKAQDAALASIYGTTQGYVKSLDEARTRLASAQGELTAALRGGRELTPEERKSQLRAEAAGRIAAAEATLKQAQAETDLRKATTLAADLSISEGEARVMLTKRREADIRIATRALDVEREALQTRINAVSVEESLRRKKEEQDRKAKAQEERARGGGGAGIPTGDVQSMLAKEYADRLKLLKDFGADVEKEREAIEEDLRSISLTGGMRTGGLSGAPARGVAARPDDELNELRKAAERSALAAQDWSLAWTLASNEVTEALAVTGNELANLATSAAASLGTFIAESAAGQEAALANLLKAASQQAGGFVMLEGGKLIAAGVTSLGLGNPIGAGQIAGGAGLVAAGAAIQAGGPLAVSSLLGQSGGAGAAAASGTATDPGARARPARTMPGEGGGTQLTIVYGGLSGPTADDGARALKKGEQRARKRGY
jgi:hypothetical protein